MARVGGIYNVWAGMPQPNLKIVKIILHHLGKPKSLMRSVQDRPGHDRRYETNGEWLGHARSGEYRNYYQRHYTRRAETFSK